MSQPSSADPIYRIALAAACMSHGLRPEDTEVVDQWLQRQPKCWTLTDTFVQIEQAIAHAKVTRDRAKE